MENELNCYFLPSESGQVLSLVTRREGEEKLGEKIKSYEDRFAFDGRFALLGVREDVGPRANLGFEGAKNGFDSFFSRFLNMQSNRFLVGDEVIYWGVVNVENSENESEILKMREFVEVMDHVLLSQLEEIYSLNLIPIVVGGGHNNAFSLIKAFYQVKNQKMYVVNIDPHADFRLLEGRHSGNSFSYAMQNGFLVEYACLGLHESYNSESMLERLYQNKCWLSFFEDYLFGRRKMEEDLKTLIGRFEEIPFGFELDVDSLKFMPSSAFTPSGFTVEEARKMVHYIAGNRKCTYFHLPEAAPVNEHEGKISGKVLAYLVVDFLKASKLLF